MGTERQAKEASADNTYLLCPLGDDVVEAIRTEAYKSREKEVLAQERKAARLRKQYWKARRKSREAGDLDLDLIDDSGISCRDDFKEFNEFGKAYGNPLLYTQYVRRAFYCQLNKEQMQRAVAQYYGWEKWSEDPWGSFPKFCEWVTNARDNEMAVWAVNETLAGRVYLLHSIFNGLDRLAFSQMTEKNLNAQIGYGGACFLYVKSCTGWDEFDSHYLREPLPIRVVNEWVSKVYPFDAKLVPYGVVFSYHKRPDGSIDFPELPPDPESIIDFYTLTIDYGPFTRYQSLISGIFLWYFTLKEFKERAKGHPEWEAFFNYHAATDTQIAEICQQLSLKGYRLPDKEQSWQKLEQSIKNELKQMAAKYNDIYPLTSVLNDNVLGDNILKESYLTAQEGLLEGVDYWKSKAAQATIDGLKGSLLHIVKNDFIDAARKAYRKHEVTESQIDATRPIDEEDAIPFFETIPSPEPILVEPIDLKSLGLDLDRLTPRERWVMQDVYQGLQEGCDFGSKLGGSFTERWGQDYGRNIKAYNRGKKKLKQP